MWYFQGSVTLNKEPGLGEANLVLPEEKKNNMLNLNLKLISNNKMSI